MEAKPGVLQTVDKYGYIITSKKNVRLDIESDINKKKRGKHGELKLWIKDLITLKKTKGEEFFSYCGIIINIVDLYGIIVAVKSNTWGTLYKVDDGTGEIDCWQDNQSQISTNKILACMQEPEHSIEENTHPNMSLLESSVLSENVEDLSTSHIYKLEKEKEVVKWLREQTLQNRIPFSLGSTVHLRGKLSDFRGERCVRIYNLRHVISVNEEIDRRFELNYLYKTVYSQKAKLPQTSPHRKSSTRVNYVM